MKKTKTFAILAALIVVIMACTLVFAACDKNNNNNNGGGDNTQQYDPETRPFILSISTPDRVFNPFFSTSAYDSEVIGQTQIGMLSTDKNGNIVCGENEPTVALDYQVTEAADKSSTTYEFVIKNGVKFSDGRDLTIKDVLFNLYVYLDPSYTGSATIYSTNIIGLQQYRLQNPNADITDDYASSIEEGFVAEANIRINDVVEFVRFKGTGVKPGDRPSDRWTDEEKAQLLEDYKLYASTFKEELTTDWNAINREDYKDWEFTEKWQIFLLNDGGYNSLLAKNPDNTLIKDENGNYKLDETEAQRVYEEEICAYITEEGGEVNDETIKEYCINSVYDAYFPNDADIERTNAGQFETVAYYWVTGSTVREKFTAEAKSNYFGDSEKVVPNISGITTRKTSTFKGKDLGEEHDVLTIRIKDVDPKAIYNFSFTVSPMHYYSGTWNGKNYIEAFNGTTEFGLEFGQIKFMEEVINAPSKVGLPLGAGPYKATHGSGTTVVNAGTFFDGSMINYERNEYFTTLGSGIENAKIKYLRYKVVAEDQIINSLTTREIDYGQPSATQENIDAVNDAHLSSARIQTSGYGYVGINPRFVPNINVRRAIMKALRTQTILDNYYKNGLAEIINRPMSKTNWAYPDGVGVYQDEELGLDYRYDATGNEIEQMIKDEGYNLVNGVYEKTISGFGVDRLDYKFTIAGGSTDHPAYKMFLDAAELLNKHGFAVKVVSSAQALSDLSNGKLEVWAAAWSSTIDPDMYQVYHKDSRASSTSNWGYNEIKAGKNTEAYAEEYEIITELSELIDEGRATTDQKERIGIYADALDMIMRLAVEFPTYQRYDLSAFNGSVLDESTMTPEKDRTPYNGLLSRIWEVNYR